MAAAPMIPKGTILYNTILDNINCGKKLAAIKEVRAATGLPLREARELVERIESDTKVVVGSPPQEYASCMFVARDLHVAGAKDDSAKPPVELVPAEAIEAIARVMDFGRNKYVENGWKAVPQGFRRYLAALLRHAYALQKGEVLDPDSGLPHVYHIACNGAFLAYFHARGIACRPFEVEKGN